LEEENRLKKISFPFLPICCLHLSACTVPPSDTGDSVRATAPAAQSDKRQAGLQTASAPKPQAAPEAEPAMEPTSQPPNAA
jgi:hypothetical protein